MAEQIPSDRFTSYVAELVDFSRTHRVPSGKPENLTNLSEALRDSESFAADFGSSIRSIIFREHCKVSEPELIKLVVFAWGGEQAGSAPDSAGQLPSLTQQIRTILRGVSRGGLSVSSTVPAPVAEVPAKSTAAPIASTPLVEQAEPEAQLYHRQLKREDPPAASVTARNLAPPPRQLFASIAEPKSSTSAEEQRPVRRFHPSGAEILATGLTGMVVALLFSVGSLPVYRSRVSVYLPSAASANPLADEKLLTEKTAQRVLSMPHQDTLLRQDTLSRGMRDLHLGDSEPLLYADLVSETARQLEVKQLPSSNLYEVTCDSWNARLATAFCNQFIQTLDERMEGSLSSPRDSDSAHIVDAATVPGIQVYPRWVASPASAWASSSARRRTPPGHKPPHRASPSPGRLRFKRPQCWSEGDQLLAS